MDAEGKLIDRIWQSIDKLTNEITEIKDGVFGRLEALELQVRTANGKTAANTGDIKELAARVDALPKSIEGRSAALQTADAAGSLPDSAYHPIVKNLRGVPVGAWLFLTITICLASTQGKIMDKAESIGKYYIERRYPPEPKPAAPAEATPPKKLAHA